MSADAQLLDTPKRISLKSQSAQIRATLKDFERTFAANNDGRKPSKDDIKVDTDIAAKYKEYNRIRDVLAGRLEYAALSVVPKSPTRRRTHERNSSDLVATPRRRNQHATPRKSVHPSQIDPYDATTFVSPRPLLLHAIGPTPQRDGKILGLFDLLSNSTHSSRATPSSKKRKLEVLLEEGPEENKITELMNTPSQKLNQHKGDLLDFLAASAEPTPQTGHRKHSRTPVSEGRKFMLSQFFATPNTARFADLVKEQTPLRNQVLGNTPDMKSSLPQAVPNGTPTYFKRSTSFKDRLLSASQSTLSLGTALMSPPATRAGPPTLRHLNSLPKMFIDEKPDLNDVEEDENQDDLEALREIEESRINVLVSDSQQVGSNALADTDNPGHDSQSLQKVWKKKGQKRTTRRTNMRPAQNKSAAEPKFVMAEADEFDDEGDVSHVNETQLGSHPAGKRKVHRMEPHDEDDNYVSFISDESDYGIEPREKSKKVSKVKAAPQKENSKKAGTINPNAISHMNFRTLKIKNKNTKAKGKGRFGRGRR